MSIHDSPGSLMGHDALPSDDGSWNFMDHPGSGSQSDSPSVAFLPSPASRSLASYGVVTHMGQGLRGPSSSPGHHYSPEPLTMQLPPTSSPAQATSGQQPRASYSGPAQLANTLSLQFPNQVSDSVNASNSMDVNTSFSENQYSAAAEQFLQFQDAMLFDQQLQSTRFLTGYWASPPSSSLSPFCLCPSRII